METSCERQQSVLFSAQALAIASRCMGEHELKEMPQGSENWATYPVAFISKNGFLLSQLGDGVFTPCSSFGISSPTASCCLWASAGPKTLSQLEVGQNDSISLHLKTHPSGLTVQMRLSSEFIKKKHVS